ncbi:hypothetical protein OE09_0365 [Flavobacteriaceae bacterium MAR_2010_72]|nr:hypothetical protein OE09_0365 [Flavobacteriaceae bacterium MAR_2010_72]
MKSITLSFISFLFCIQIMQANVVIINGLTHSFSGVSGQTFQGQIMLANTSNVDQRVTFDLSEAIYTCADGRVFTKETMHENSSTNWFESSTMDKVLAPKEKYIYKYSITIPNDATLNGSYWTTLMVNVDKPIREEVVSSIGLDTKIRYAIRLLTDVNVKEEVDIDFEGVNLSINSVNRKRQLEIKVLNQSIFIENVKLSLEIFDTYGNLLLDTETKRAKVFPEVCRDFIIDVSKLPQGTYQCVVMADSRDEYVGTNMSLTIE